MKTMKSIAILTIPLTGLLLMSSVDVLAADEAESNDRTMEIAITPYNARPPENADTAAEGKKIYEQSCIFCHGKNGDGKGPVAFFLSRDTAPHPRDLTTGIYKFRSTVSGDMPLDEDIFRTITNGVVGFMPSFVGMDSADRWKVIYFIKSLYPDFDEFEPQAISVVGGPIPATAQSVNLGYKVYQDFKCWECHGGGGQGDGEKAPDLKDDWDMLLPPRNLTMSNSFKNGNRPEDLYRTIMAGLDGGAMPSYADFFESEEENVWHLINYINSFSTP